MRCVEQDGSEVRDFDPLTWRDSFAGFLAGARTVFVPSDDAARRLTPFVRHAIRARPPEHDDDLPPEQWPTLGRDEPLRVAVLGGLSVAKGLAVVALLAHAVTRALGGERAEFVVAGGQTIHLNLHAAALGGI